MLDPSKNEDSKDKMLPKSPFIHKIEASAILTIIGIVILFSTAIIATLIAPNYIDSSWISPSSPYQVQMYEVEDPNIYVSGEFCCGDELQYVHHLKDGFNLLAFQETDHLRIVAEPELEKYITSQEDTVLKLTSRLLLLREPVEKFNDKVETLKIDLLHQKKTQEHENHAEEAPYHVLELYDPSKKEAFSYDPHEGIFQNWAEKDFVILDEKKFARDTTYGIIYVLNPSEYLVNPFKEGDVERLHFDPKGTPFTDVDELLQSDLNFRSRKDLIAYGEQIYAIEGCWYCHTDQTRTLIQDVVLNGSDSYPAPPSSPNEYIYQKITFAGTRRIGPDISRVGIKRPSREWHMAHFWDTKLTTKGSIMPVYRHFFDPNTKNKNLNQVGTPNLQFEAIYQYMMTKGTRITAPSQGWWIGKDPVQTKAIIDRKAVLE